MRRKLLLLLSFILGIIFTYNSMTMISYAEDQAVETKECDTYLYSYQIDKSYMHTRYCPEDYTLEIVDEGFIASALNTFMNLGWLLYVYLMYYAIFFLDWAFSLEVIDYIAKVYERVIITIKTSILDELYYLMFAVAIAWATYYWVVGKTTKMWKTLLNIIVIQALILLFFSTGEKAYYSLPNILTRMTDNSSKVSTAILSGFATEISEGSCGGGQVIPNPQVIANPSNEKDMNKNAEEIRKSTKQSLFCFLVLQPYQIVNFGSIEKANDQELKKELGKAPWEVVVSATDSEQREKVIEKNYKADDGEKNIFYRYTEDGYGDRFVPLIMLSNSGVLVAIVFSIICLMIIIWQFIAISRGILGVFFLVISLWPEYGLRESVKWFWSMIQALFMKVFYTIYICVLITVMLELMNDYNLSPLLQLIYLIGFMIGLWQVMREVQSKIEHLPLSEGIALEGVKEVPLTKAIQDKSIQTGKTIVVNKPVGVGKKAAIKTGKIAEKGIVKGAGLAGKITSRGANIASKGAEKGAKLAGKGAVRATRYTAKKFVAMHKAVRDRYRNKKNDSNQVGNQDSDGTDNKPTLPKKLSGQSSKTDDNESKKK